MDELVALKLSIRPVLQCKCSAAPQPQAFVYSRHMLMDFVIAMVQYLDTETVAGLYQTILPWLKVGEIIYSALLHWYGCCTGNVMA
jgi:hypothetical protein